MIVWPTKKAPARSFVPANSKRGRQIAAQHPAQEQMGQVLVTPQEAFRIQRQRQRDQKSTYVVVLDESSQFETLNARETK